MPFLLRLFLLLLLLLLGEINPAVTDKPAPGVGKVDDAAFTVEEEEVFGVGDGERGIGFFGTGGDFGADGTDEDLQGEGEGRRG